MVSEYFKVFEVKNTAKVVSDIMDNVRTRIKEPIAINNESEDSSLE